MINFLGLLLEEYRFLSSFPSGEDSVEKDLFLYPRRIRVAERGRSRRGEKGSEHIFREQGWQFRHACFSPRFTPACLPRHAV